MKILRCIEVFLNAQKISFGSSAPVIPSKVEGFRNDTLKLAQRDPLDFARDDGSFNASLLYRPGKLES